MCRCPGSGSGNSSDHSSNCPRLPVRNGGKRSSAERSFGAKSSSTDRIFVAAMQFPNSSRISVRSIVQPAVVEAFLPSFVVNPFSGDSDGHVVSWPVPSSTSQASVNSAAPFISGHAR